MKKKFLYNKNFVLFLFVSLIIFGGLFVKKAQAANVNTSVFTSKVEDFGAPVYFDNFSWIATTTSGVTDVTMQVRTGSTAAPTSDTDPNWTAWTAVTNNQILGAPLDGKRYLQYRATLTSQDINYVASFGDVQINWSHYDTGLASLISSPYDSLDASNAVGGLTWTQNAPPANAVLSLYLRTGGDAAALATSTWVQIASTTNSYITPGCTDTSGFISCNSSVLPTNMKDGTGDEWFQYQLELSSNGLYTPVVSDITIKYVVNAPPEINIQNVVSQAADGIVLVNYQTRDIDTNTGATPGKVAVNLQYCVANCGTAGSETWATASNAALTGDFGSNVSVSQASSTQFTSHSLTWNPKLDYNAKYNATNFKIRLLANDSEAVNNLATVDSNTFVLDTTNPVISSFVVDSRSSATNTLTMNVFDNVLSGLQMKISNSATLIADGLNTDSGNWINFISPKSWNLSGNPETIYYQFKDKYGNISNGGAITHSILPDQPANIIYQDVSNVPTSEWREFVAWGEANVPALGFKQYNIYRSTDGVNYILLATQTDRTINYILDNNLNTTEAYYYKVAVEDNAGDISNYSAVVYDVPNGQGGSDLTSPIISSVVVSQIGTQSALITWNTNEPSNSIVEYISSTGGNFTNAPAQGIATMKDNSAGLGQHSVRLNNLAPNKTYYFQVKSTDPSGNLATDKLGTDGYTLTTLNGPQISHVSNTNTSNTSATVTWDTDVLSNSYVVYSTKPDLSNSTQIGISDSVLAHSISINGLTPGIQYYYYVKSGVAEDKNVVNGINNYYTFTTTIDTTPPVITFATSTGVTNITDTSATISWTTNELATSSLSYGLDINYGTQKSNTNLNINHIYSLSGLTKGTTYHLQLANTDANGNTRTSADYTFTTTDSTDYTPPVITFATSTGITNITNTNATISWQTNEVATSSIEYGLTSNYSSSTLISSLDSDHRYTITGLTKGTQYHFRLVNTDASGNTASSTDYTFSTVDTTDYTPPVITFATSTGVTNITDTSATISWTTDELATSSLFYGLNTSYGSDKTNTNLNINHTYTLTGLAKGTKYHLQLANTDASGNTMISSDYTFTTTDSTDYSLPVISATSTDPVLDKIAVVNWDTNRLTTSTLEYGVDATILGSKIIDNNLNKTHSITISSLLASTEYYYKITAMDTNHATTSSEGSFTTLQPLISTTAMEQKLALATAAAAVSSGGGGVLIINKTDRIPPVISKVNISNITNNSALVTWSTNENADGYVQFGLDSSYGSVAGARTRTTNHQIQLNNLKSGSRYHYNVSSVDASGNYAETGDLTFSTLSLREALKVVSKSNSTSTTSSVISSQVTSIKHIFNLADQAVQRLVGVIKNNVSKVSLNFIASSLGGQQRSINELAKLLPVPIMSGSPSVTVTDQTATIGWKTDKAANSLVAFSPNNLYNRAVTKPYLQIAGNSTELVTDHQVTLRGLTSDTLYHYQLESKPAVGPAAKSNDFTFQTKRASLGIQKYAIKNITSGSASFQWTTSVNTDATVQYTPYRNNKLDLSQTHEKYNKTLTTIHDIGINDLIPGVAYRVTLSSKDTSDKVVKQVIDNFFTNKIGVAPAINQVQTISAISPGKNIKIQTVISWLTNEPATTRVYYKKGVAKKGDKLIQKTELDQNYSKKHVVVITKFAPGSIYSFQTESINYNGKISLSKIYTILTPSQEDSVFQVIVKNFQGMFGWINKMH